MVYSRQTSIISDSPSTPRSDVDWGISSQIKYFLEEEVAIICLANFGDGQSFRKVDQIADILVEEGLL